MVDASALGTVCMKIKHKRDMEYLFDALGGEGGLELIKDLTIGDTENIDMIDAGKSWAMVNDKVISSLEEGKEELKLAHGLIAENGRFQKTVKLAFFNMGAVQSSVGDLATKLKTQEEDKKKREAEEEEAERDRLEAEQDAKDIGGNLSYYPTSRDWKVPEANSDDIRTGNARIAAGGAPQVLEATEEKTIKRDKTRPTWRPIANYMIGEPSKMGDFKVYIEEPEVVGADKALIFVDFKTKSYSVRVETGEEPLVLGPVACGQLDLKACSWRLSPGKRMTISLVKARTDARNRTQEQQVKDAMEKANITTGDKTKEQAEEGGGLGSMAGMLLTFVPVLISFWYFYVYKGQALGDVA
eukprot:CAMPEP_0203917712 /NCGR_PEP_ID=MMETSP0359-20131031/58298_1 /ASSEMBLY_ACC=CAM_ASM_000338 /TAXON_ID=268821 /ORGANISM="Scrippsiella Hangoei, Strain SHTV-5" /LENGTH=355 /DNA_ID=CAMNT_0050844665 /DNA_START=26 /DNA_END=1090 /DNA_ORIENTATION=-